MALLNTQEKKFPWGGRSLFTTFPAHGAVSIVGSVAGGELNMGSDEAAKIHAAMLMEGTRAHSKKEIQHMLDAMGASLQLYATATRLIFSARVRSVHTEALLALIAEILSEPLFSDEELSLLKKREEAGLALEAQDTRAQAGIYFARILYKKGHPNWSETTSESRALLKKLTSKELQSAHAKVVSRADLIISMAGDIPSAKAHKLVEKYFALLPHVKTKKISFSASSARRKGSHVQTIEHKASIDYMVGLATGITSQSADYPALMLGLQVLGNPSGFSGRLMKTVREVEGLTYGTYAYMSGFDSRTDGYLMLWATFASQLYKKGKAALMREAKKIVSEGITDDEARKHRELYVARIKVQLANSGAFARVAHNLAVDGRTMSYLDDFNKKVSKLSAKKVNKALKKYLIPSKLSESAAGPVGK